MDKITDPITIIMLLAFFLGALLIVNFLAYERGKMDQSIETTQMQIDLLRQQLNNSKIDSQLLSMQLQRDTCDTRNFFLENQLQFYRSIDKFQIREYSFPEINLTIAPHLENQSEVVS